jgi:putative ABC transport system substrate-binding protein
MHRREFVALLGGGVIAWPLGARAQQPAIPVIGYLNAGSPEAMAHLVTGFRKGLSETGYIEGRNVAIEYRWADNQYDRFAPLAADLVRRQVAVIAAVGGMAAVLAAKAATATIPIVFSAGGDPIKFGLVPSLNRPGGNVTGVTNLGNALAAKQLQLLAELVPKADAITLLANPKNPNAEADTKDVQTAAGVLGLELNILHASTPSEIDATFATLVQQRAGGLLVAVDAFFNARVNQLAALALRHAVPTICTIREFAAAGGLASYGPNVAEAHRQVGVYTGRVLKGENPGDLPVVQSTKFEFVINLQTAKIIGIEVPAGLLATADEVIE